MRDATLTVDPVLLPDIEAAALCGIARGHRPRDVAPTPRGRPGGRAVPLTQHTATPDAVTPPPAPKKRRRPLLLRRPAAAAYVGVSLPTWDRHTAAGRNPAPLKLGGGTFWRRGELAAWVRAGCPGRDEWAAIRDTRQKRRGRPR